MSVIYFFKELSEIIRELAVNMSTQATWKSTCVLHKKTLNYKAVSVAITISQTPNIANGLTNAILLYPCSTVCLPEGVRVGWRCEQPLGSASSRRSQYWQSEDRGNKVRGEKRDIIMLQLHRTQHVVTLQFGTVNSLTSLVVSTFSCFCMHPIYVTFQEQNAG